MLKINKHLFNDLEENEICYCHWKSNEFLQRTAEGTNDIDLLVDSDSTNTVRSILSALKFIKVDAKPHSNYPAIEDYLGFDYETGEIVHLHIHYQLILGSSNTKEYRLPWEDTLLRRRVRDPETGIYKTDPSLELLLLIVRYSMKLRWRDLLQEPLGNPLIKGSVLKEYNNLCQEIEADILYEDINELLTPNSKEYILDAIHKKPTVCRLFKIRKSIQPHLKPYRRFNSVVNIFEGTKREVTRYTKAALEIGTPWKSSQGRKIAHGGYMISFIGADGSGKSTVSKEITEWLNWRADATYIYMGYGASSSFNPILLPVVIERQIVERFSDSVTSNGGNKNNERSKSGSVIRNPILRTLWRMWRPIRAVLISFDKRIKLNLSNKVRNNGMIIITDRYPKNKSLDHFDTPALQNWETDSRLVSYLRDVERRPYIDAERYPPDIVFKLHVSPETSIKRKGEFTHDDVEEVKSKTDRVENVSFEDSLVIDIDTEKELEEVILEIKRHIWDQISG